MMETLGLARSFRSDARSVVAVAAPLYLSMIVVTLGSVVNTVVLGRFGTEALAAFALTGSVYFPAAAAVSGTVRGMMPFVSSNADFATGLVATVRNGARLAVVVGGLGGLAVLGVEPLARATGVPQATIDELGAFPFLMAAAVVVTSIGAMATSTLVGLQRSRVVLRAGIGGAVSTAVLSVLLVDGPGPLPEFGLDGAGIALLVSSAVIAVVALFGVRREMGEPIGQLFLGAASGREIVAMAKVGVPMAGTVLVKFGVLGVLALAASRISSEAGAAHGIATGVVGLTFTAAVVVGQATIPLVAPHAENGDGRRASRAVLAGLVVSMATIGVVCAVVLVFRSSVTAVFTTDSDVREVVVGLLPLVVAAVMADGVQATWGFGLTGLKRTVPSLVVFTVVYGALALAANPIASRSGIDGLWAVLVAANVLVAVGQVVAFRRHAAALGPPRNDSSTGRSGPT